MAERTDKRFLLTIFIIFSVSKCSAFNCTKPRSAERQGEVVIIRSDKVCNFIYDCPEIDDEADKTDEANCGTECNFDNFDNCGWLPRLPSNAHNGWSVSNGVNISGSLPGPTIDKSAQSNTGGFFVVSQTVGGSSSYVDLRGPTLHDTADGCKFSFYYYFGLDDVWQLRVLLETNYTTQLIKDVGSSSTGSRLWKKKYVDVGRVVGNLRVVFQAVKLVGTTPAAGVAIDSIKFFADECGLAVNDTTTCTENEWRCANGGCIRKENVCNYAKDCQDNSDEAEELCANSRRCNAETDFCNFTNGGTILWQRLPISADESEVDWPATDHTYLTPEGSVFVVAGESDDTSRAILIGPYLAGVKQDGDPCKMTLYNYIQGTNPGKLAIGFSTRYSNVETISLSMAKSSEETWKKTVYTFTSTADFQPLITVMPDEGSPRSGVVAVDDIIFSEGCVDAEPELIEDLCTFEDDSSCSWQEDEDSPLDWTVIQGYNADKSTALRRDHTTQDLSGHYLYLDSINDGHKGLSARYLSQIYQPGSCELVFWYYVRGYNANKLSIYTRQTIEGSLQLQWRRFRDNVYPTWKAAILKLNQTKPFQIVIEGSAGVFTASSDNIGIDDLGFRVPCLVQKNTTLPQTLELFDRGQCEASEYSCSDGTCRSKELFCDTKADCDDESDEATCPLHCHFDDDLCGWTNDVTAGNSWNSSSSLQPDGPKADHTDQSTGQFLYIDGKDNPPYQSAQLISPQWTFPPRTCQISLWYYRFGSNYGSLSIKARPDGASDVDIVTLSPHLSNFNKWTEIMVDVPSCITKTQILLTALNSFGNLQHGGYAIDDFSIECETSCPANQCTEGGHCYTPSQKCDLTVDCCLGQSDENDCDNYNMCSFDNNLCIWNQDEKMSWTRKVAEMETMEHDNAMQGSTMEHDNIPTGDGSFLEVHFEASPKEQRCTLHSYVVQPTYMEVCELRFSYFAQPTTRLTVFVRHSSNEQPEDFIWRQSGMDTWKQVAVTLSSKEPFEVVIEASSISNNEGLVGFDSSSFTPFCDVTNQNLATKGPGLTSGILILLICMLLCIGLLVICFFVFKKSDSFSCKKPEPTRPSGGDMEENEMDKCI